MEESLNRVKAEINLAENNFNHCISKLKEYASKWSAIQLSFSDFQNDLSSFQDFPDLRSRLELSQLSACDSIISEMTRQLVLYDLTLTKNRSFFLKTKKQFESKPKEEAWSFPPTVNFLPDLIIQISSLLDETFNKVESRKLAIYKLTNEEESIGPESLERLINSIA
ncbi:hypothetical protein TRFO_36241 [Tritrichomonas foetus]|uniref:Uncharacterized protein n=1 Tax=Tritrichomonas foetus TaxID=1144522 RepID=A0A1J4JJ12_9EUKA|nr:hypothetical protein TRFO_36241 [Tritrichomonas foetus]|eukprot:OHS97547.1 hypothetical protein TRFO_36241 [Tritrichomonas foetus]